jgi:hypothetical protein
MDTPIDRIDWQNTDPRRERSIYKTFDVIICRSKSKLIGGWEIGLGDVETKHGYSVHTPFEDFPGLYEDDNRIWNRDWFWVRQGPMDQKEWDWKTSDPRWEMTRMTILIQDRGHCSLAIVEPITDYTIETDFPECHNVMAGDDWNPDWKWMRISLPERKGVNVPNE